MATQTKKPAQKKKAAKKKRAAKGMKLVTVKGGRLGMAWEAAKTLGLQELPITVSLKLRKLTKAIKEPFDLFQERMKPLIEEYGDDDGSIDPSMDSYSDFQEAAEEMLNEEVDFEVPVIKIEDLDREGVVVTESVLDVLLHYELLSE